MGDERSTVGVSAGYRRDRVPALRCGRWSALYGILAVVGCIALTWSPLLPWLDSGYGVTTNRLNVVSGGFEAPQGDVGQASDGSTDGSGQATIPGLLAIPLTQGGTDASARHGVFVLVLGATALLIAVLELTGEARRRRRMARDVCMLAALALVPLLYDGIEIRNATGGIGSGVTIGLIGALVATLSSAWVYRSLRDVESAAGA